MKKLLPLFVLIMIAANTIFSQTDDFKIIAVNEAVRSMEPRIFENADPALIKQYMPNGAPASMSSFVLFVDKEAILFDTGLGGEGWEKKIIELGVKPENIKLILLTHLHSDHVGGLLQGDKRRFPNAKVFCSEPEYGYWLPKEGKPKNAQVGKIQSVYGEDFSKTFTFGEQVFSGGKVKVKALDAAGHTPGHTAFLIESPDSKFLIVGDLLHAAALQLPKPEVCSSYDMDKEKTVASRKRILDFAAQENIPIGGMHFPPPNVGKIKKTGDGYMIE